MAGVALAIGVVTAAVAQSWPSQVVKIVIPFPPGGGIDILVRGIASELSTKWKQPVIIDNRAGASTFIGAEIVARAEPDGYTLFATVDPTFTSNRFLFKSMPYDPDKSFAPIMQLVRGDNFVLANPSVPAKDLKELIALAKKDPKKFTFGSYGNGTHPHLMYEYINKKEGLSLLHVPYKGIAPVMLATVANEVNLSTGSAGVAGEMMRGGKLKALAVAGKQRAPQFPNVPTTAELGYPWLQSFIWYGLFAPAGTPPAIIDRINRDVRAILANPEFAEKQVNSKGLQVIASTPQQLSAAIREDSALIGEMVRAAGVQPE